MNDFESRLKRESQSTNNRYEKVKESDLNVQGEKTKDYSFVGDIFVFIIHSLITLLLLGMIEVINADFDWSAYTTVDFWQDYLVLQFTSWATRFVIRMLNDRKQYRSNKEYLRLENEMQNFVEKDNKTPFIERYSDIDRKIRKRIAFKNKQKRKLIKISNKYRITNIIEYVNAIENDKTSDLKPFELNSDKVYTNKFLKRIWANKQERINIKLRRILKTLTNDWLDQNLESIKVKYNQVNRTILVSGFVAKEKKYLGEDYKENSAIEFAKMTIPSTLLAMGFMFIILPLSDSSLSNDMLAWFRLVVKAFVVAFSGITMWNSNPELFKKTKQKALGERVNRLNIYSKEFDKDSR